MSAKRRRRLAVLALAGWLGGCASTDPATAPERHRDALLALESRLAPAALRYAGDEPAAAVSSADGVTVLDASVWAWSADSPVRVELRANAGGLERVSEVRMSAGANRCIGGSAALAHGLFCAGPRVAGGVEALGAPGFASQLPKRGGFRDLAIDPARGLIYVLDGVTDRLVTLGRDGAVLATTTAPPGVYRLVPIEGRGLAMLSGPPPHLSFQPLDAAGLPSAAPTPWPRAAPARDAAYDAARSILWLVGPEDGPPRRAEGPLRHLRSALTGLHLGEGTAEPSRAVTLDLGALDLVDASRVVMSGGRIALAATGSDSVALVDPDSQPPTLVRLPTGPAPVGLAVAQDGLLVAHRVDATVARVDPRLGVTARAPVGAPPDDLQTLGRRLFYGTHIWRSAPGDAVTCNTCHWETGSDHRLQPGFLERRRELTRPLGGIGAVSPIFTTAGADSLAQAIEGLVRGLDERFWQGASGHPAYWERPSLLSAPDGSHRAVSPRQIREGLMSFLATLPRQPGPLRVGPGPDPALLRRGFDLFSQQCSTCHALAPDMRRPERIAPAQAMTWLTTRGLAFSQPGWSRVGISPSFHPEGHRVTPLSDLGRPGPFFSNASAASLGEILERLRPASPAIHGGLPGEPPAVSPADREALQTFLLWL